MRHNHHRPMQSEPVPSRCAAAPVWAVGLLVVIITFTIFAASGVAQGQAAASAKVPSTASSIGSWTAPVSFCTGAPPCVIGANAVLMHTGKVLFYYYPQGGTTGGSEAMELDPTTGALTNVTLPMAVDIFCSGVTILPNGQVAVTGGVVQGSHNPSHINNDGTTNLTIFDPVAETWTTGANMTYPRWYPSSVELGDGSFLELSGSDATGSTIQTVLEQYKYNTGTWTTLPASANLPAPAVETYPRMSLLTTGKVFLSSPSRSTYSFDPTLNTWSLVGNTNNGPRFFAPHVLLPGLTKVMVAGGSPNHDNGGTTSTPTAETIDFSQATPTWSYTGSMNYSRYNENLVLLPDGTVLAVGGGGGGGQYTNPIYTAEIYNPTTGVWTPMAAQAVQRTYHSTAVLIPDGRVVSSGSDYGSQDKTYEIYSPPYLFNGARPTITSSPSTLTYGQKFNIITPDASTITRVALIRPGATTHADDFDQRYVDLTFKVGTGGVQATAPANGNYAPPGYYMLVIVNSSGVPSVMPFLQIGVPKGAASEEKDVTKGK